MSAVADAEITVKTDDSGARRTEIIVKTDRLATSHPEIILKPVWVVADTEITDKKMYSGEDTLRGTVEGLLTSRKL